MQRFADSGGSGIQQPMDWEELLTYIRAIDDFQKDPLAAIMAQTEVIGDPALPKPGERAALRWVGAAFDAWEESFPLEQELQQQLRPMKSVMARAALSDAAFFQPGHHPLHLVLDAVHDSAIGWQPSLGRAGEPVIALVAETLEACRDWLDGGGARLQDLAANVLETTRRSKARADRMALRAVEAERGRVRSARARVTAARVINAAMEEHPVPEDISRIFCGPWYESAQLVLLKFGEDSAEWRDMSAATLSLASSLQPVTDRDEGQKRELLNGIARAPTELKRWLLSLQHESETLEQILGTVEYAQLRAMRGQSAEAVSSARIAEDGGADKPTDASLAGFQQGQWFLVSPRGGPVIRAQLAMDQGGKLLFCNQAGLKVLALDHDRFSAMLEQDEISHLPAGASFSRALVIAAGISSDEELSPLIGEVEPAEELERVRTPEPGEVADKGEPLVTDEPVQLTPDPPAQPELPDSGRPELPMGTWLGFHDVDPPLLAKLALHDKVRKLLIFVNRKGVEQRRLEEEDYFALIGEGQVDILEARNNFREQVERARARLQRHQT